MLLEFGEFTEYPACMAAEPLYATLHLLPGRGVGGTEAERLRSRLERVLPALDGRYPGTLAADWRIGGGRAVALLSPAAPGEEGRLAARAAEMLFELVLRARPAPLAVGLGLGPLTSRLERDRVLAMTGPGFDRARRAAEEARRGRRLLRARGFGPADAALGGAFSVLGALVAGWTLRQTQLVRGWLRDGALDWTPEAGIVLRPPRRRREVAAAFDLAPSTVTEALQAADAEPFRDGLLAAAWTLAAALREGAGQPPLSASSPSTSRS